MRDLLELLTGQVAFLSGLLAGFSMTAALHILRYGIRSRTAQVTIVISLLSSLLFIVALYVDVRLTIELAGKTAIAPELMDRISAVRYIGTTSATVALVLFVITIGLLGWLSTRFTGLATTTITLLIFGLLVYLWTEINALSVALG